MRKLSFFAKYFLPVSALIIGVGATLGQQMDSATVQAASPNYNTWDYADLNYIVDEGGRPSEVEKKTSDFYFANQVDHASYARFIIYSDIARAGAVQIFNNGAGGYNSLFLNGTRIDYQDWGNYLFNYNINFNAGKNTFLLNMHHTGWSPNGGIGSIVLSDELSIVSTHTPDVEGETYYANNLHTQRAKVYYKDSLNNIFDPNFDLDRIIPQKDGDPLVFTVNNASETEYFLDLSSWSSVSKTIDVKVDNNATQTITVPSYTEDTDYSIGNIGSGEHTVTVTTSENTARVGVRKLFTIANKVTVTFNSNGGSSVAPMSVVAGSTIVAPTAPTKDNAIFAGWYKDSELTDPFDFDNDTVDEDITLNAKWENFQVIAAEDLEDYVLVSGRRSMVNDTMALDFGLSSLEFDITGGGSLYLDINLTSNNNSTKLAVEVDNSFTEFKDLSLGQNHVCVASSLSASKHNIKVYKTTQANNNLMEVISLTASENAVIEKPAPKDLKIEVIGDSIAAGEYYTGSAMAHNAYYGFPKYLKDAFNADVQLVATAGIGLYAGYVNGSPTTDQQMEDIYDYNNYYRSNSSTDLDTTKFVPDVVVINLCGNDLGSWISQTLGYNEDTVVARMGPFIEKLHTYYPNAKIVWVYGEFINRGFKDKLATAVNAYDYASFLYTPKFAGSTANVDDHPSQAEYVEIADLVATEVTRSLNKNVPMQYRLQNPLTEHLFYECEDGRVDGANDNYNAGGNWSNDRGVGDMQTGGSVEIDVSVTRTSEYALKLGGAGGNGNVILKVDGELLTDSVIYNTGDWHPSGVCKSFVNIGNITLTKGEHTLRFEKSTNGGYINYDYIELIEDNALACETFYQEFMKKTQDECTSSVLSHDFDTDLWDELKTSFLALDSTNREYLKDTYDDLVARYTLIIANYHLDNFLVDGEGNLVVNNVRPIFYTNTFNPTLIIIMSAISVSLLTVLIIRRRKHEN